MPFRLVERIIIDSDRRGKALPAVRAPNKHDISSVICSRGPDTSYHVDIVTRARPRVIDCQKYLTGQSFRVDWVVDANIAPKVDRCSLVEGRCHGAILCVSRPDAPNLAGIEIHSAQKQVAV